MLRTAEGVKLGVNWSTVKINPEGGIARADVSSKTLDTGPNESGPVVQGDTAEQPDSQVMESPVVSDDDMTQAYAMMEAEHTRPDPAPSRKFIPVDERIGALEYVLTHYFTGEGKKHGIAVLHRTLNDPDAIAKFQEHPGVIDEDPYDAICLVALEHPRRIGISDVYAFAQPIQTAARACGGENLMINALRNRELHIQHSSQTGEPKGLPFYLAFGFRGSPQPPGESSALSPGLT